MSDQWYYAQQNKQLGPVSFEDLAAMARDGRVALTDLIWREGMANWLELRVVPEFASQAAALPPLGAAHAQPAVQQIQYLTPAGIQLEYAGFWLRFVAYIIDAIIVGIPSRALGLAAAQVFSFPTVKPGSMPTFMALSLGSSLSLTGILVYWLYFAFMESSAYQATLGKMALGLIVTDEAGGRLSFGRATARAFSKYISSLTLGIGYIMAGLTQRKQALHDIIANALVVRKGVPRR